MILKMPVQTTVPLVRLAAAFVIALFLGVPAAAEIRLTDAAGRDVRLAIPAQRIATNESLLLLSLALIDPDPVSRLAGWAAPQRIDRGFYQSFRARFPSIDSIPVAGGVVGSKTSPEAILAVKPDVFVVSLWDQSWTQVAATLEAAGVPVVFLDGPANDGRGPAETTISSIELLGKVIGREAQAHAFSDFVRPRYALITDRTRNLRRPSVLIDAHAGEDCCSTPGRDNRMTEYLKLAGGESIGVGVPGYDGRLSAEYVLVKDPEVYIATGGPHLAAQNGLVLGDDITADAASRSFAMLVSSDLRSSLTAVRSGRAHAVSHQLSISVLNVLAFECYARWIHPDLFTDIDPAATLAEINNRFLSVPLEGTFWLDLDVSRIAQ
ncbi:Fe3+-hydroxamate ABC transporter substrate-binding protein [Ensifer sp. Root31]|uniref:ABC transporter substrate-binding protein n=1 Tax=Ensifer sp. Root31 TaxID=1736512 RepID=UPI00070D47A8|nr:ABC transporter substrate-binding protein [Ensifer sp. Root31]KQU81819.1 Fe3+-hydroxamate ABC transporter substrate-binding protein [Ensifer sp. Root31]